MKDKLKVTVELPSRENWIYDRGELFIRFPAYKNWYQFWKNSYEELPLKIIEFN